MDDTERELADAVEELSETLTALEAELEGPPRGPLGLPRPPTPGELLRFTEQYTLPALISILEASIQVLELLGAAIRAADGRPLQAAGGDGTGDRLATASRRTLETLDDALAEVQNAATGGEPDDPEVRRLLEEARALRAEVDDRLAEATGRTSGADDAEPVGISVREPAPDRPDDEEEGVDIDVDEELETIKREIDGDDEPDDDGPETRNSG